MSPLPLKERLRLALFRFRIGDTQGVLSEAVRTELARWPSYWAFAGSLRKDKENEAEWLPCLQEEHARRIRALRLMGVDSQTLKDAGHTTPDVFFEETLVKLWGMAGSPAVRNQLQPLVESLGLSDREWWLNAMKSRTEDELHAMLAHIDPTQKDMGNISMGGGPLGMATVTAAALEKFGAGWVSAHLTQSLFRTEDVTLMASHGVSFPPSHVLGWIESMMEDRGMVLPLTGMLEALPPDDWIRFERSFGQKLIPVLVKTLERHLTEPLDPKIRKRWESVGEARDVPWQPLHAAHVREFQNLFVRLGGKLGLDQTDANGWSALHRAAVKGNLAEVRFLLDMGANAALPDLDGHTPLTLARMSHRIRHLDHPGTTFPSELESVLLQASLARQLPQNEKFRPLSRL